MFKRFLKIEKEKYGGIWSSIKEYVARVELKTALKIGVAAALSWFVIAAISKFMNRPDNLVSGAWCVVTSIVVLQAHLGGTYKAAWMRFLGVLIGSVLGSAFTSELGANPLALGLSVGATVLVCTFFNLKDSVRISCLSVAVIMILWGIKPDINPWLFGLYRFIDSCLGIVVAMIVAHLLWPSQAKNKLQTNLAKSFGILSKLFRMAIDLESPPEQTAKTSELLENEVLDLIKESKAYLDESKLELLTRQSSLDDWKILLDDLEDILENVMTLKLLPKGKLALILDDSLDNHLSAVIDQSDLMFQELSKELETNQISKSPEVRDTLIKAIKGLKEDLLRFRGTKTTRKFDLSDVEGFFVFFYGVGGITENLLKADELVPKVIARE